MPIYCVKSVQTYIEYCLSGRAIEVVLCHKAAPCVYDIGCWSVYTSRSKRSPVCSEVTICVHFCLATVLHAEGTFWGCHTEIVCVFRLTVFGNQRFDRLFHVLGLWPSPQFLEMSSDLREITRDEVVKVRVYCPLNESVLGNFSQHRTAGDLVPFVALGKDILSELDHSG
jgi:hypothetical protein